MLQIKELYENDSKIIETLYSNIFMAEPWNDDWSDQEQLHQYIMDIIGNRNSLSIGLYEDDQLIGLCLGSIMHWYSATQYLVSEFCIQTKRQGTGCGTFFIKEIEEYVKQKHVKEIYLETDQRMPAFQFYEKNGFGKLQNHVCMTKKF